MVRDVSRTDDEEASAGEHEKARRSAARLVMDVLSSTRTAVVLLSLIAVAAVVGTALSDPVARKYVYGRAWFHVLLGLLGLNLVVCMLSRLDGGRRRIGMARAWSLLTHAGILLVLIGAMVTLILSERGWLVIHEGQEASAFSLEGRPAGGAMAAAERAPLGFHVRLIDFRITRYPDVDRLFLMRAPRAREAEPLVIRFERGRAVNIPGTQCRLKAEDILAGGEPPVVEVSMVEGGRTGGPKWRVPATVGTTQEFGDEGLALAILRYEPSFKIDVRTKTVSSDSTEPSNPALQVALVRDGEQERPRWLFARMPGFRGMGHGAAKSATEKPRMRYLHPSGPVLVASVETPSGSRRVRLRNRERVPAPWDPGQMIVYERLPGRIKEFESEVEVVEDDAVVRRHVIRVNSPLVHKATKLSQVGYDERGLHWTRLGVSRDSGQWLVYAGFVATILGLVGRFYLAPVLRRMRARPGEEDSDGTS